MYSSRAAQTRTTHRNMHAYLAPVLALALVAPALSDPRDRFGYEREIDSSRQNQVPTHLDYVLREDYLSSQKNRAKLITRPVADNAVADNVILLSNVLSIVDPSRRQIVNDVGNGDELVRRRRGYNLENVRVPARYPYLPVPNYNRIRRWG